MLREESSLCTGRLLICNMPFMSREWAPTSRWHQTLKNKCRFKWWKRQHRYSFNSHFCLWLTKLSASGTGSRNKCFHHYLAYWRLCGLVAADKNPNAATVYFRDYSGIFQITWHQMLHKCKPQRWLLFIDECKTLKLKSAHCPVYRCGHSAWSEYVHMHFPIIPRLTTHQQPLHWSLAWWNYSYISPHAHTKHLITCSHWLVCRLHQPDAIWETEEEAQQFAWHGMLAL